MFRKNALSGDSWSDTSPTGGLTSTSEVLAKAAPGAGLSLYVTCITVQNSHQTQGTEVTLLDGSGGAVIHRGWAQQVGGGYTKEFVQPRKLTANTALYVKEVTATGTAGVIVDICGFTSAD